MNARRRRLSLAQQVFALQLAVIVLLVLAGTLLAAQEIRRTSEDSTSRRVLALASSLAQLPEVHAALADADPSAILQPIAESVRHAADVDFVVFMATDRTRYSHPTPATGNGQRPLRGRPAPDPGSGLRCRPGRGAPRGGLRPGLVHQAGLGSARAGDGSGTGPPGHLQVRR
jgi:two-component system CitB family sensor kinase